MKILLVDDDLELGTMLSEYLGGEGFSATHVLTGQAGVSHALSGRYDALVLDVMLPDLSGTEVLRQVRQQSNLPIIMLTAKGDNIDRVVGLEMGADDYMPKPCYPRELVARLRAVLRRVSDTTEHHTQARPDVLMLGALTLNPGTRISAWRGSQLELTATEFNMLELLLRSPEQVVTKDTLSLEGIGRPREAYDRSVDVHICNLRQKLHQSAGETLAIETIRSIGYKLVCC
ncbi:two-component system, OmpR family, response regulator [Aeromonas sp. RU39B]|uniref:response regulator transcription factor n=1 Tax=Aeromonas sp. RU39B TaxID=1907416 RepID=UPI000956AE65|nr:response regulator transcription factor [Aeromonas sp. RU39B]SIQ50271.1 two-component system, OmpR family, response regulator [Aeromonas sp. RU39B]